MRHVIKIAVLVGGASLLAASPVFAQGLEVPNLLNGLDLDPFHILTPAPPAPAPLAPAPHHHHHHRLHHATAHHHGHSGKPHAAKAADHKG